MYMMLVPRRNYDLFDDFFDDPFFKGIERPTQPLMMKTDIREDENNYIIDVDLPGFEKENINISLEDGYLTIHGMMDSSNKEEKKGKFLRRERYVGECSRSFYVGEDVKEEEIKASFKNGILTLDVPKVKEEEKKSEKKFITID